MFCLARAFLLQKQKFTLSVADLRLIWSKEKNGESTRNACGHLSLACKQDLNLKLGRKAGRLEREEEEETPLHTPSTTSFSTSSLSALPAAVRPFQPTPNRLICL